MSTSSPLPRLLDRLEKRYGPPATPVPRTALEWVLWENVAYLAPDERRAQAFEALREASGFRPRRLLALSPARLLEITRIGGIHAELRAQRLRDIAERVRDEFGDDLDAALQGAAGPARRALKKFPTIGDPGADRILLFTGADVRPALESNGLRVLTRLGFVQEARSYSTTYRAAVQFLTPFVRRGGDWLMRAHTLLRTHGQELCKNSGPHCDRCPLASACPVAGG